MKDIHKQYFLEILKKYRSGKASDKEISFLESWYNVFEISEEYTAPEAEEARLKNAVKMQVDQQIAQLQGAGKARRLSFLKYAAAAALLILTATGVWFFTAQHSASRRLYTAGKALRPGGNRATLTLSDGSRITLTEAANGKLTSQAGVSISKTRDGLLVYQVAETASENTAATAYNTIETPKGGQYEVILPDGTTVWLNAASSLSYPAAFRGTERKVELKGEAYFEVTKNAKMPFRVVSKGQTTEVLGTHFNISAYADEPAIKTTLLEGSIKITTTGSHHSALLSPGQQASTTPDHIAVSEVNPDQFIAWKNGKFIFTDADIQSIMRQVSRWYNVEIVYKGEISKEKFGGRTSRFNNIAELLEILQLTDQVHFDVEGRRIIVMP